MILKKCFHQNDTIFRFKNDTPFLAICQIFYYFFYRLSVFKKNGLDKIWTLVQNILSAEVAI